MQPSSYYESSEQTLNGFKYKRTNKTISELFPVNENIDLSCVYSSNSGTPEMTGGMMMGWANDSAAAYVQKDPVFHHSYKSSSSQEHDNRWTNINGVTVNRSVYDFSVNCGFVFTTAGYGSYNYFTFGYAPDASSIVEYGNFENKNIVTDFEVNKIIWKLTDISGITKAELQDYYDNGTVTSAYSISASDFFANPANYLITKYSISGLAYWDDTNEQWQTNNHPFGPVILIDSAETGGFYCINVATGGQSVAPQANTIFGLENGKNIGLWNNSQNNTTAVTYNRYQASLHREFIRNFTLGNDSSDLEVMPYEDSGYLSTLCDQHYVGTTTLSPRELTGFNPWMIATQQDSYTYSLDYTGADKSHPTAYTKNIKVLLKGEMLSKILAHIGVYFFNDSVADLNSREATPTHMNVAGMMLGEMLDSGYTSGNWVKGNDIEDYNGINKDGSSIHPDFNPSGGGGEGSDEDNDDPIPTVGAPFASGLSRYYVTTAASPILAHISEAFGAWNIKDTGKDLYRNVISCKLIKSPAPIPVSGSEPFTVYGVTLQYEGSDITLPVVNNNPTASFGSYRIPRKFNDFRDYAPYTKVEIYLPYCGWTVLPSHVVGRSVSVTYYTDIIAATCKAVVYCGSNIVAEAAGVIGLDIPMVTENAGAKAEAVTMGLLAYGKAGLQTALGVGAAVATKGKAGVKSAVSGLENLVSAYSQTAMAFNQNYTEINGKNGDGCCIAGISAIVIKITRPKYGANTDAPYVPAEYGHATGFVSMKSAAVGSFTGLLVADNVDTSGISGATDREKQLIKLYLESGIYVNHPN